MSRNWFWCKSSLPICIRHWSWFSWWDWPSWSFQLCILEQLMFHVIAWKIHWCAIRLQSHSVTRNARHRQDQQAWRRLANFHKASPYTLFLPLSLLFSISSSSSRKHSLHSMRLTYSFTIIFKYKLWFHAAKIGNIQRSDHAHVRIWRMNRAILMAHWSYSEGTTVRMSSTRWISSRRTHNRSIPCETPIQTYQEQHTEKGDWWNIYRLCPRVWPCYCLISIQGMWD